MKKLSTILRNFLLLRNDPLYMNSIFMMASTAMVSGSGFFFWMIATHIYQDAEVGLATALVSIVGFIMSLSILGFNYSIIRFLPKSRNKNKLLSTCILLVSIAAAIGASIFLALLPFFSPQHAFIRENPMMLLAFLFFAVAISVDFVTEAIFLALRNAKYVFYKNIGIVFLKLLLPVLFMPLGTFGLFAAWATAISSALLASCFILYKKFNFKFTPTFKKINIKQLMTFSFTNYVVSLTGIAPAFILPMVIANTINAESAAYFYIAFMIANLLYTIPYAATQSLLAEGSHDQKNLVHSIKKVMKIFGAILLPAILVLLIFGQFILLVFGKSYSDEGVKFLQLLSLAGLPIALNAVGLTILNVHRRMKPLFAINLTGAALILFLSFIFHEHALTGIGIAWLVGHSLKTLLYAGYIAASFVKLQTFKTALSFGK